MSATRNRAKTTGVIDGLLTVLFTIGSYAAVELLTFALTLLPLLTNYEAGKYLWLQAPLALILGAILKGLDRKKHEDPATVETGLVKL